MADFTTEFNMQLSKPQMKFDGGLIKFRLNFLAPYNTNA